MSDKKVFSYQYTDKGYDSRFFKIPMVFFEREELRNLSMGAKFLYGLFYDDLSYNSEADENGRVFTVNSIQNLCRFLKVPTMEIELALNELEDIGLLEIKKQGFGQLDRFYLKKYWY